MLIGKTLENFAKLTLEVGVNLQKGQGLEIACPVEKHEVAEELTKQAYLLGAKIVRVRWENEIVDKLSYIYADTPTLCDIPKWFIDSKNYLVEKNFCYVAIAADDPSAFKDIPAKKLAATAKARSKALKKFSDCVMANVIRWCVVSVPTKAWAEQVFPNSLDPETDLSAAIEKTMRLDKENPTLAWKEHIDNLTKKTEYLNYKRFDSLRFKNGAGTDLIVGLCNDHVWLSAKETAKDGVSFVANMPTEEVFTAPHAKKVNGKVVSAMPLCENGKIIDGFSLTFKDGKIVDFSAEKGYDALKNLIETDQGTRRLGEVALIGKSSPIAKSKILFYNTLFDENASCHLALGKGYPTTIKDGEKLNKEELSKLGLNDSVEHVDFMIGTEDLTVIGIEKDGSETPIFIDGDWCV